MEENQQWRTNMNHNYHDDLRRFKWNQSAWHDTGAKLLQELFASTRRIEIKAVINVFETEILARKHRNNILLECYIVIENIKAHKVATETSEYIVTTGDCIKPLVNVLERVSWLS